MVDAPGSDREAIKQSLLAKAAGLWAAWDSHPTVEEDPALNYTAKQTFEDGGNALTLIKMRCDGLTMEQLQPWIDDPVAIQSVLNNRMESTTLPDVDGHKTYHFKLNMPAGGYIISNRSIIVTYYRHEMEDGTKLFMSSSQGNEEIVASRQEQIGSDVVANNIIVYVSWKPYDGGIEIQQLLCMDPAGMIPGMIKTAMSGRMAKALKLTVDYLKNGTIPEPVF